MRRCLIRSVRVFSQMHISDNLFEITSRVETIEFARFDNGKKNSSRHSSSLGVSSVPSLAANDRVYINNRCTFPHLENLFAVEEITKEVEAAIPGIPKVI